MSDNPARVQIELPAETWLAAFLFLPRQKLISHLCYVCLYFWRVAHIGLHERGKITLSKLVVKANQQTRPESAALFRKIKAPFYMPALSNVLLPFPETKMPKNVVCFERIEIKYVNDQVVDMLDKMSPIFTELKCIRLRYNGSDTTNAILCLLKKIDPMVGAVNLLSLSYASLLLELPQNMHSSLMAKVTLLSVKMVESIQTRRTSEFLCDWLNNPDGGGAGARTKMLHVGADYVDKESVMQMITMLIEKFLAATSPAPFIFRLISHKCSSTIANSTQHNPGTGEHLIVSKMTGVCGTILICRHPDGLAEMDEKWLKNKYEQLVEYRRKNASGPRKIVINIPSQTGFCVYSSSAPRYTPSYTPSYSHGSPQYSPATPRYSPNSPQYTPTPPHYYPSSSPVYSSSTPRYQPSSNSHSSYCYCSPEYSDDDSSRELTSSPKYSPT